MARLIGYARVSRKDQNADLQVAALKEAGVPAGDIHVEKVSGAAARYKRKALDAALARLESGDTLLVWKLDRLGRTLSELVVLLDDLRAKGITFVSLTQPELDGRTASGRLITGLACLLAAYERDLLIERTEAGLAAARAKGKTGGRKKSMDAYDVQRFRDLVAANPDKSVRSLAKEKGVSLATLYRHAPALRAQLAEETAEAVVEQVGMDALGTSGGVGRVAGLMADDLGIDLDDAGRSEVVRRVKRPKP